MTGSWKLTPREPGDEAQRVGAMEFAMCRQRVQTAEMCAADIYRAMSEAAPTPPDEVLERMATAFVETWQPRLGLMDEEMHEAVKAMRAALAAAGSET